MAKSQTRHHQGRVTTSNPGHAPAAEAIRAPDDSPTRRLRLVRKVGIGTFAVGLLGNLTVAPDGTASGATNAAGFIFLILTLGGLTAWIAARRRLRRLRRTEASRQAEAISLIPLPIRIAGRVPSVGPRIVAAYEKSRERNVQRRRWSAFKQVPLVMFGTGYLVFMANQGYMANFGMSANASSSFGATMASTLAVAAALTMAARVAAVRWIPTEGRVRVAVRFQAVAWVLAAVAVAGIGGAASAPLTDEAGAEPSWAALVHPVLAASPQEGLTSLGDREDHDLLFLGPANQPGKTLAYDRTAGEAVAVNSAAVRST